MEAIGKILKQLKDYVLIIVIGVLLVVIYGKNIALDNLREELNEKPKIEYIARVETDKIEDDKPVPVEIVKWKASPPDTVYKPLDLTKADSAKIAQTYMQLYSDYAEKKIYNDVLKDDSLAFIRLEEIVQYNSIFNRKLFYEHRTPTVQITNTKIDRTTSIIGGIGINNGVRIEAGLVTGKNSVYIVNYNPFNNTVGGSVYLPIFNF